SMFAARYTTAGGWSGVASLESSANQVDYYNQPRIAVAIASGTAAAVSWVQHDGTNYSTYVSRWNGSTWTTTKVDNNTNVNASTSEVSVAIDTTGKVTAVWLETTSGSS